jgi:hypothetical protein
MNDIDLKEEQRQEWLQDARHEELMGTDYDFFLEYNNEYFEAISEAYWKLKSSYDSNGWNTKSYDINGKPIDEIIEQIKERL